MIKIDLNQFWQTLEASELLSGLDLTSMKARIESRDDPPEKAASRASRWLSEQKLITPYHAEILLAGHSGPFQFGNYVVQSPANGDLSDIFLAVDRSTRFPVWLHFLPGNIPADLDNWNHVERIADGLDQLRHPNIVPVYETVITPAHRFVVSGVPAVSKLSDKLPAKSRLGWAKSSSIVANVAAAVSELHDRDLTHGKLSFESIWIGGESRAQLLFPFQQTTATQADSIIDLTEQKQNDIRGLAEILLQMITGQALSANKELADVSLAKLEKALARFEPPAELTKLIFKAVHVDKQTDPKKQITAARFRERLLQLGDEKLDAKYQTAKTEKVFQLSLDQWSVQTQNGSIDHVPGIDTNADGDLAGNLQTSQPQHAEKIRNAIETADARKKSKWQIPAAIAGGLLAFSIAIAGWAIMANRKMVAVADLTENSTRQTDSQPDTPPPTDVVDPELTAENAEQQTLEKVWLIQELVADNQEMLWESPTSGGPITFEFLPNAPQMIANINWDSFLSTGEGTRILESLGPHFQTNLTEYQATVGFPLTDIKNSTVSLHSNDEFRYESFSVVRLKAPVALDACLANWQNPQPVALPGEQVIYQKDGIAYWVVSRTLPGSESVLSDSENTADAIMMFVVGKREWVEQVALGDATPVSGPLYRLALNADATRHVNLFFLRTSLFNDEGKAWLGDWASWVQPELRLLLPDEMRGAMISLHLDNGNYLEMRLDHRVEARAQQLAETFRERLDEQKTLIERYVVRLSSNPYWDQVRQRYERMLTNLTEQWRWDVEFDDMVANAWLPPMATHNLIAGSELTLSFSRGQLAAAASTGPDVPQSLDELLATKRSLKITNPPDLNVLLQDIQTEVRDQYLQLPFEFNIRLMGNDLKEEGITQNQRPGELNIVDKSLAEILTQVMASANPNRNISGPADPNCKLVWVVANDPEDESKQAVLITTRKAAETNGYQLPAAFVE